jgi:hypothetical protein
VLEILLLVSMCRYLNRTATAKGRAGWPFVVLMVFGWVAAGVCGAVIGFLAEGPSTTEFSLGALGGYIGGVIVACVGMSLIVNAMPAAYSPQRAVSDEQAYVEWRKRQGARPTKARLADDEEEDEVVDLQPANAPPPPRAQRAWKKRDWHDR